jgi:hypothetical protein
MSPSTSNFHAELMNPAEGYRPFGDAGPVMNAHQLHHFQVLAGMPGRQYGAATPQVAQLVAALLARRTGAQA